MLERRASRAFGQCTSRDSAGSVGLAGDPEKTKGIELGIETDADIVSPLTRTFWTPSQNFSSSEIVLHQFDEGQAAAITSAFARMQRLDFRKLRRSIRELTANGRSRTLGALAEEYPIKGGVVELLGYLQIAHDDGHLIDNSLRESVTIEQPRQRHLVSDGNDNGVQWKHSIHSTIPVRTLIR